MELNLNSMAGQRISAYAYSVNICSACIYRILIFCKYMRVVLSMYLQNTHILVIRFDLVSQDMIFTLSTFERGNLYAHLGLKVGSCPNHDNFVQIFFLYFSV